MTEIRIRRGPASQLPVDAAAGEPLLTTDTHNIYVGGGPGIMPVKVTGVTTEVQAALAMKVNAVDLGTAADKDVPVTGNASAGQVVTGSDTRLSNSRTPTAHKASHAVAGSDALAPSDIEAADKTYEVLKPSGGDDTAAFAAVVATGNPIWLVDGAVYLVSSMSSVPKKLSGYATIQLTARNNDWILINSDNVEWQNVTIDANNLATRAIVIDNANHVKLRNVTVKNAQQFSDSTTTVDAIRIKDDCNDILIEDCTVSNVVPYDNATVSDTLGAARGIHIENVAVSGTSVSNIRINKCNFSGVGTREDGDAIAIQGFTSSVDTEIADCYFTALGKRAIKIMSPGVKVHGNRMFSTYAGAGADVNLYLYSYISVYASDVEVYDNVGRGGSVQFALDIGTPAWAITNVKAYGNQWLQDAGDTTYSIGTRYIATVDHSSYMDNTVRGMSEGLTVTGAISALTVDGNSFDIVTTASGTSGSAIRLAAYSGNSPSHISIGKNYVNVPKYGLLVKDASANIAYSGGLYGAATFGFLSDDNSAVVPFQTGVHQVRTPASGANPLMVYNTAGTPIVQVTQNGEGNFSGAVYSGSVKTASNGNTLSIQTGRDYGGAATAVNIYSGTFTHSSGAATPVVIRPTYNQTGTASATDLTINRTETAVGSGTQNFADFQISGVSKFSVDRTGKVTGTSLAIVHKSTHAAGGTDALTPADIGAATAAQGTKADSAVQTTGNGGLPSYASNAAAVTGGLAVGTLYRQGDFVAVVH